MSLKQQFKEFREFPAEDFRILAICEQLMITHQYAPLERIVPKAVLSSKYTRKRIRCLNEKKLLKRWTGPYEGYALTFRGFDVLALKALVESDVIDSIGDPLGVGKEADVLACTTPSNEIVALKLHRLGKEFRKTRRLRPYIAKRRHISSLYESRLAAEREYQALTRLSDLIRVPQPIAQNRHALVMELIEGDELQLIRILEENILEKIATQLILFIKTAFLKAQVIHGDLSEYNCLITPDFELVLIDWPQWVEATHPNAKELLSRDLENIISFFKRRFNISLPDIDSLITDIQESGETDLS